MFPKKKKKNSFQVQETKMSICLMKMKQLNDASTFIQALNSLVSQNITLELQEKHPVLLRKTQFHDT